MENKFYIYAHINPLKNEIFYIGKGQGKRAYSKKYRSDFWNKIVKKYGYIVDILEEGLTNKEVLERELFYIAKIGRRDLGKGPLVNLTDGGEGCVNMSETTKKKISETHKGEKNPNYGKKTSEETRKKISESAKGKIFTKEHKEKLSESRKKRKPISEETRKKMSKTKKGKKLTEEHKQKMSKSNKGEKNPFFGKKHSEETKQKISEVQKGKKLSEETKKKISEARKNISQETRRKISEAGKGRKMSEETRKKMSEAAKLRAANKKH